MSDNEYYSTDEDSDNESEGENTIFTPKKVVIKNTPKYNEEDEDEDEEDPELGLKFNVEDITTVDVDDLDFEEDDEDDEAEEEEAEEENKDVQRKTAKTSNKPLSKSQVAINVDADESDDGEDEEDDEYGDDYLQKFDIDVNKNYIHDFHPECLIHNYDEISKLSIVVRDDANIIVDHLHKTIPFLTKYEKTKVLGQRSKQIECGAKPFVKVPENIVDGYIIAELELQQKRIPFIIKRPIPGGAFEYWNLKDLEIIAF